MDAWILLYFALFSKFMGFYPKTVWRQWRPQGDSSCLKPQILGSVRNHLAALKAHQAIRTGLVRSLRFVGFCENVGLILVLVFLMNVFGHIYCLECLCGDYIWVNCCMSYYEGSFGIEDELKHYFRLSIVWYSVKLNFKLVICWVWKHNWLPGMWNWTNGMSFWGLGFS